MRKIAIAVAIIAVAVVAGLSCYDAAQTTNYAEEHDCTWHYDEAGFRGKCLPN